MQILFLLRMDPTKDLRAYRDNKGVMLGGQWLSRAMLDIALAKLAKIQSEPDAEFVMSRRAASLLAADVESLSRRHIALDAMHLELSATRLTHLGYKGEAARIQSSVDALQIGSCHEITPAGGG